MQNQALRLAWRGMGEQLCNPGGFSVATIGYKIFKPVISVTGKGKFQLQLTFHL